MGIKKQLRIFYAYLERAGLFFNRHKLLSVCIALFLTILLFFLFSLPKQLFDTPLSAVLESEEGRLLGARIARDGQWRFPSSGQVPDKFRSCIIQYEDKRFYNHPGVDLPAVLRALVLNVKSGRVVSGASTLSMQVIRMSNCGGKKRNIWNKILEAFLALRLECRYSKDEILSLYASNAPFGGNVVGLEAASHRFFGAPPSSLSWGESALLAVLPNAPSLIHIGKNRGVLLKKRNRLLDKLCHEGVISEEDCVLAKEEPLPEKPYPMPDDAYHYLESLIGQKGYGRYHSSIRYPLQLRAAETARQYVNRFQNNGIHNVAVLVLDTKSGEPIAYIGNAVPQEHTCVKPDSGNFGGNGYKTAVFPEGGDSGLKKKSIGLYSAAVDIITAPRSSGSTLKPLLYAAMLQSGEIFPSMLVKDIPFRYKNFNPHNYNKTFDGAVPAHSVIERSLNVPSVRMLDDYGIERFLHLLREAGFSTVTGNADHYGLSLILGGAEITLRDLTGVYGAMARKLNDFSADMLPGEGSVSGKYRTGKENSGTSASGKNRTGKANSGTTALRRNRIKGTASGTSASGNIRTGEENSGTTVSGKNRTMEGNSGSTISGKNRTEKVNSGATTSGKDNTGKAGSGASASASEMLPGRELQGYVPSPFSAGSLWLTFEALSNVNRPEEEGDWTLYGSARKIAWKTGTSWGNRDAWSIGVTPDYVVGVWVGNATGEGRPNLTGVACAAPVMFDIFSLLPPTGWFSMPETELEQAVVCKKSGHPVTAACLYKNEPDIPVYALCDTVWVPVVEHQPDPCPYHTFIHTNPAGTYIVNTSCIPADEIKTVSWFLLPAAQEWYYMQNHLDYKKLPPLHPGINGGLSGSVSKQIDILYPQEGAVVIPAVALDGVSKGAVFRAFHQNKEAILFWHVDGRFIGTTVYPNHQITLVPSPGSHTLKLVDDAGNSASVRFTGA